VNSRRCFVLIDWWSQVRPYILRNKHASAGQNSESALRPLEKLVESCLLKEDTQPKRWEITLRLYAGWMNGGGSTAALNDYNALINNYAKRGRIGNVLKSVYFLPSLIGMQRGDRLISDVSGKWVDKKFGVHFTFTSRKECKCELCQHLNQKAPDGFTCERIMEKQVDTAIVADMIALSVDAENTKIIIISNDDDVLPGIIAANALGGDVCLINTIEKNHFHSQALIDLISGPKELSV